MKLNHAIKKIAAVGTGAMMLGMSAAAVSANLSDYPAPFIQDGEFSGSFVVGESAATTDVIGTIEIATSLQAAATVPVYGDGSEGETVLEDSFRVASGSNNLLLGQNLNIKSTLTDADLPLLRDRVIEDESGATYDVQFRVGLPNAPVVFSNDALESSDDPTFYVDFEGASWTFDMTFPDGVNFDDFHGQRIHILGEEYIFGQEGDVDHDEGLVTLFKSGVEVVVGDSIETIMVGGEQVTLEVEGGLVGGDEAWVRVNGVGRKVEQNNFYTIGGVRVYIESVAVFTDDRARVNFFIGADKLVLDAASGEVHRTVGTNDQRVRGVGVSFTGAWNTGDDVTRIRLTYTPESHRDDFSPVVNNRRDALVIGEEYVDPVFGQLKFAFTDVVPGMTSAMKEHIELRSNGDRLRLVVSNNDGVEYDLVVLRTEDRNAGAGTGNIDWAYDYYTESGREQRIYVFGGNGLPTYTAAYTTLSEDNRFIVREDGESRYTRFMELTDIDVDTPTSTIRLLDLGTGTDMSWTTLSGETFVWDGTDTFEEDPAGDYQYGIYSYDGVDYGFLVNTVATDPYIVLVREDGDDRTHFTTGNTFVTHRGAELVFTDESVSTVFGGLSYTGPVLALFEETDFNSDNPRVDEHGVVAVRFGWDSDDLTTSGVTYHDAADLNNAFTAGWSGQIRLESNDDVTHATTIYGTTIAENTERGDMHLYYPRERVYFNVFVGPASAGTSVGGDESSVIGEQVNPINVGAAILDREAAGLVGTSNLLVVGGPCVNTVAAQLMGNPADCTAGFTQGSAMIKVFPNAGNTVSLLVAGYTGADTRLAARVLANYRNYEGQLVGDEVVVSGTTIDNVDISAPTVSVDDAE